jgi:hypothetical protein
MNWHEHVRPVFQRLIIKLINEVDWSWTKTAWNSGEEIPAKKLQEYQLFILSKIITNDIEKSKDNKGIYHFLLLPTNEIEEIWKMHSLRPLSYSNMCQIMLQDRLNKMIDLPSVSELSNKTGSEGKVKHLKEVYDDPLYDDTVDAVVAYQQSDNLIVRVNCECAGSSAINFKVSRANTKVGKVRAKVAEMLKVNPSHLNFVMDGEKLRDQDDFTVFDEDDEIMAYFDKTGC